MHLADFLDEIVAWLVTNAKAVVPLTAYAGGRWADQSHAGCCVRCEELCALGWLRPVSLIIPLLPPGRRVTISSPTTFSSVQFIQSLVEVSSFFDQYSKFSGRCLRIRRTWKGAKSAGGGRHGRGRATQGNPGMCT